MFRGPMRAVEMIVFSLVTLSFFSSAMFVYFAICQALLVFFLYILIS